MIVWTTTQYPAKWSKRMRKKWGRLLGCNGFVVLWAMQEYGASVLVSLIRLRSYTIIRSVCSVLHPRRASFSISQRELSEGDLLPLSQAPKPVKACEIEVRDRDGFCMYVRASGLVIVQKRENWFGLSPLSLSLSLSVAPTTLASSIYIYSYNLALVVACTSPGLSRASKGAL